MDIRFREGWNEQTEARMFATAAPLLEVGAGCSCGRKLEHQWHDPDILDTVCADFVQTALHCWSGAYGPHILKYHDVTQAAQRMGQAASD